VLVRQTGSVRRLAVTFVALVLVACSTGDDTPSAPVSSTSTATTEERSWDELARTALEPLAQSLAEVPAQTLEFVAGIRSVTTYRADVERAVFEMGLARDNVGVLPEHAARDLFFASASLQLEYARTLRQLVDRPADDLRHQITLLATRVRRLGESVLDCAWRFLDVRVDAGATDSVPDWTAEGLGPGPPLEPLPEATVDQAAPGEARPTQPMSDWERAVSAAGAPATVDLEGDLVAQARAFDAAAASMRDEPAPDIEHGHDVHALLRIGWLIKADAARAAQLGLLGVARGLDVIAVAPPVR
jgi:hypothetical protein